MTIGTMTVDTAGETLKATSYCTGMLVSEDGQVGTAAWTVQAPDATFPAVTVPAGAARQFNGPFVPGSKVAVLTATTGSMTFTRIEYNGTP